MITWQPGFFAVLRELKLILQLKRDRAKKKMSILNVVSHTKYFQILFLLYHNQKVALNYPLEIVKSEISFYLFILKYLGTTSTK
jgi:hypothetical protein